jgi:hypothetical protein
MARDGDGGQDGQPVRAADLAASIEQAAGQADNARFRALGSVNVAVRILRVVGDSTPALRPWTERAAIRTAGPLASPQARLARANALSAARNTRRPPNRSAARPPSSKNPPKPSA